MSQKGEDGWDNRTINYYKLLRSLISFKSHMKDFSLNFSQLTDAILNIDFSGFLANNNLLNIIDVVTMFDFTIGITGILKHYLTDVLLVLHSRNLKLQFKFL